MALNQDLREFIGLLNSHDVDYVVVGAHALAFHGRPRFTGDLDILLSSSAENGRRLRLVLDSFGFGDVGITESDLQGGHDTVQLGVAPNRIDLMFRLSGIAVGEVFRECISDELDGLPIRYISCKHLIQNKRSAGRPRDLADADELEKT